jgi:hypothetical protein
LGADTISGAYTAAGILSSDDRQLIHDRVGFTYGAWPLRAQPVSRVGQRMIRSQAVQVMTLLTVVQVLTVLLAVLASDSSTGGTRCGYSLPVARAAHTGTDAAAAYG